MAIIGTPTTHFHFKVPEDSTSVRRSIFIALDTGEPATGFTLTEFTVSDAAEFAYFRDDASAAVDAAFDGTSAVGDATTLGTWETSEIKEISSALMPGWYELGFPNAAFIHTANGRGQANVVFGIKTDATAAAQDVQVTFELEKAIYPRVNHHFVIPENSTSVLVDIFLEDDDGTPRTGLTKTEFEVSKESLFAYHRTDGTAAVDAAFDGTDTIGDTSTLGTWITSSIKEISSSLMPGWYELGLPDAALVESAEGNAKCSFHIKADTDAHVQDCRIEVRMTGGASGGAGGSGATSVQRFIRKANSVNVRENIYFVSDATGEAATGLDKNDFTISNNSEFAYYRGDASAAVDAKFDSSNSLGNQTTLGTWETSQFKEISSTLMPGWYELSFPNAAFIINQSSGVKPRAVTFLIKPEDDASVSPVNVVFDLFRSVAR